MTIVTDVAHQVSSKCATTNTNHRYTWEELNDQVQHSRKSHTDFPSGPVEVDDSLPPLANYYRVLFSILISRAMRLIGQGMSDFDHLRYTLWEEWYAKAQTRASNDAGLELVEPEYRREGDLLVPADGQMLGHNQMWKNTFSTEAVYQCERAVKRALDNFDAETYKRKQARGAAGGRAYCTYTLENFLETAGMTASQAAAHLGIKVRNVHNMRKRYRNVDARTGEIR